MQLIVSATQGYCSIGDLRCHYFRLFHKGRNFCFFVDKDPLIVYYTRRAIQRDDIALSSIEGLKFLLISFRTSFGCGQAVRQWSLEPRSQVRILAPEPAGL